MLCFFSAALGVYILWEPVGRWVLSGVLALWLAVQLFCHEYFTLFGASPQKLAGYSECFAGTVKLFPAREGQLVPDLYHIVLHLLLIVDLVVLAL